VELWISQQEDLGSNHNSAKKFLSEKRLSLAHTILHLKCTIRMDQCTFTCVVYLPTHGQRPGALACTEIPQLGSWMKL